MSTSTLPTPAPAATAPAFDSLLPLIELGINTTLTVLGTAGVVPGGPAFASLAAALEAAIAPLISSIRAGNTKTQDVMAGYGALIGVLNTLKSTPGIPKEVIAKAEEYIGAAQDGTSAYLTAAAGYSADILKPVTPIVPPAAG